MDFEPRQIRPSKKRFLKHACFETPRVRVKLPGALAIIIWKCLLRGKKHFTYFHSKQLYRSIQGMKQTFFLPCPRPFQIVIFLLRRASNSASTTDGMSIMPRSAGSHDYKRVPLSEWLTQYSQHASLGTPFSHPLLHSQSSPPPRGLFPIPEIHWSRTRYIASCIPRRPSAYLPDPDTCVPYRQSG